MEKMDVLAFDFDNEIRQTVKARLSFPPVVGVKPVVDEPSEIGDPNPGTPSAGVGKLRPVIIADLVVDCSEALFWYRNGVRLDHDSAPDRLDAPWVTIA